MRAHHRRNPGAHTPGTGRARRIVAGNRLDRERVRRQSMSAKRTSGKRTAQIDRKTAETEIHLKLTIEGSGRYTVSTGIRFFDHMLELFTRHGAFDLDL